MEPTEQPTIDNREVLRRQYREHLSRYKSANADLADIAWTLSELEQQIGGLEDERKQSNDPYLSQRLSDLRRWRDSLEEAVLRHMYLTEELSTEIAQLRAALEQ